MTTQLAPHQTSLPPPHGTELTAEGHTFGWLGDGTIGFRGFANLDEAMSAAWMAHRTLARRLARIDGTRLAPIDVEPLALAGDGASDGIIAGGRRIGTLIRPGDDSPSGPDSFGFEIDVPAPHDPARLRAAALFVFRTLRRSGIRWTMWRTDTRAAAPRDTRDPVIAADTPTAPEPARRTRVAWPPRVGTAAALAIAALVLLGWPLATSFVVAAFGSVAAVVAVVAVVAIVHLVVTDVWGDRPRTDERRPRRDDRAWPARGATALRAARALTIHHHARSRG